MRFLPILIMALSLGCLALPAVAEAQTPPQASPPAAAEPSPEALAAAKDLLAITSGDITKQLINQISNAFWPTIAARAKAQKIDDATIAEMRAEFEKIELAFVTDAMKEAPPIYARHFTVAELKELAAFYRTPTGSKALRELPQVMGEFTTTLVPKLQALQQETSQSFDKILRAHGYLK